MRKTLLAATAAAALLAGPAWAQDATTGTTTDPAATTPGATGTDTQQVLPGAGTDGTTGTEPMAQDQMGTGATTGTEGTAMAQTDIGAMSADELIGTNIEDPQGNNVGEVSDVILAQDGSRVQHILVDVGGFLGIGSRTVALDPGQMQMAQGDGGSLVTSMTREQLEALPAYEKRDGVWGEVTGTAQ